VLYRQTQRRWLRVVFIPNLLISLFIAIMAAYSSISWLAFLVICFSGPLVLFLLWSRVTWPKVKVEIDRSLVMFQKRQQQLAALRGEDTTHE